MFGFAAELDAARAKEGLPPLLSLGIGAPHMSPLSFSLAPLLSLTVAQSLEPRDRHCHGAVAGEEDAAARRD